MLLELQNLGKSFGEHEVLRDVNAGVERGDRIGIIGANGTGKTTLLRILCGESLPDAGDAEFGTGVTTGYLEQNARLDPSLDIYATMRLVFTPALDAMLITWTPRSKRCSTAWAFPPTPGQSWRACFRAVSRPGCVWHGYCWSAPTC